MTALLRESTLQTDDDEQYESQRAGCDIEQTSHEVRKSRQSQVQRTRIFDLIAN
jgi:hypothetical protein